MRSVSVRQLQANVRKCVDAAQKEQVVVTRHGHPAAIVVGVEGQDWEDVVYRTSPSFWKLIVQRRKQETIPLTELRKRVEKRWARRKKSG